MKFYRNIFNIIFTLLTLVSCSLFKKEIKYIDSNQELPVEKKESLLDHLNQIGQFYLQTPNIKKIHLSKKSRAYLNKIFLRVRKNNELLIPKNSTVNFNIIDDKVPFIFSLPKGEIFLSSGLITKYLKNENLLVSALVFEFIKSTRGIYRDQRVIPVGVIYTPEIISLTKIKLDIKMEIQRWSYMALKRADFDPSAILVWIQIQNKNTLDFSLMNSNNRRISKEEFLFKNFLVHKGGNTDLEQFLGNSSQGFYKLLGEIKRKIL